MPHFSFIFVSAQKDVLPEHLVLMNSASALAYRKCARDRAEVNEN